MKKGHLSEYFVGVAVKRLSAVEADMFHSHQHEFNGVDSLKKLFGQATGKQKYLARFIYLNDNDDEPVVSEGFLTWYDARERHLKRSEHRLYFPTTTVSECAAEGDILVIGRRRDGSVLVVIAENESTIANQVQWLFGVTDLTHPGYSVREELETEQDRIAFASRLILETIGVTVEAPPDTYLDDMLHRFNNVFPTTREFSKYARSTIPDLSATDDTDSTLMAWMEREEILFRTLERHLIGDRLITGFDGDVDGFISFSLSVQNRRKSRVGYALENHLESLFVACAIRYSRTAITENKSKPDFLFPGSIEYHNKNFDPLQLTMLGVKSSCKDRWRQVLAEADRIERKHLLTLETAISANQTDEMQSKQLQLILPRQLHATYTPAQQSWLIDIDSFIALIRERQQQSEC
jgi:EcoRII C terminal